MNSRSNAASLTAVLQLSGGTLNLASCTLALWKRWKTSFYPVTKSTQKVSVSRIAG